jgi:dienelactone hydrolase
MRRSADPVVICFVLAGLLAVRSFGDESLPSTAKNALSPNNRATIQHHAFCAGNCFAACDTLNIGEEKSDDARACLEGLKWKPEKFDVRLQAAESDRGDWLVRFPSATPVDNERNDSVALEWYQAKDTAGKPIKAPAAVIVHESGSNMMVGRLIAKMLRTKGVHTFLIHLPYYGVRRGPDGRPQGGNLVGILKPGIADTRRARDAIAALPLVDSSRIALQGTSLGGFVAATTAGLDNAYQRVFILLAGGDIYSVLMNGQRDAVKVRAEFQKSGLTDEELKNLISSIEPLRLAHRIKANQTWLYSGAFDEVVPLKNSERFAAAAKLPAKHHITMLANHYSGILYLPPVLMEVRDRILAVQAE